MPLRKDISSEYPITNGASADIGLEVEALIVGAGFSGIYLLHKLRDELGLECKILEAGSGLGGVWHWNCYPGARTDSSIPFYEYSIKSVWKDWAWTEKYPGYEELRKYFQHVDNVLNISKDVSFNTRVVGAEFSKEEGAWKVRTEDGRIITCRFFIIAAGFAAKRHFPDLKGLEKFNGTMVHSSFWPEEGIDLKKKRMAVIGTGCSGVQIVQECGPYATAGAEITVFQRTPCIPIPMRQRKITREEQDMAKKEYPEIFRKRRANFNGASLERLPKKVFDDSAEEREATFERMWDRGGLEFLFANYSDYLSDMKSNAELYKFWALKTRARIHDQAKRDILVPHEQPYAFGTKRPPLEDNYYEQFNSPYVKLVDIKEHPIVEITEMGILTANGTLHEFDIIVLATGFDTHTGEMKNMGLKDINGVDLSDNWKKGTWSYLGMTCHGYPNMFFMQGAQGKIFFSKSAGNN
jgi:cation diffusion facilitator CzcD-associated flavoprotein CzcO